MKFQLRRHPVAAAVASAALAAAVLAACGGGASSPGPDSAAMQLQSTLLPTLDTGSLATTSADAVPLDCAPTQVVSTGGWSSCNVQWIGRYPIPGVTVGARVIGNRLYVSNWTTGWHVFDITDPQNPQLLGRAFIDGGTGTTVQAAVENEDPATNGSIAVLSRALYNDALVLDTRDPANMTGEAVAGAASHTHSCLFDCQWSYASSGAILDLRTPGQPKMLPQKWTDLTGTTATHDVTEIKPGMVVTASDPANVLDTTDPAAPKLLFSLPQSPAPGLLLGHPGPAQPGRLGHNVGWPRQGDDRFFLGLSEGAYDGRCELYPAEGRSLYLYDTTGWKQKRTFAPLARYTLVSGNADTGLAGGVAMIDSRGNPSVVEFGVQGCSVHWFDPHPNFHDGGLVALASFSHGMRLLNVQSGGRIEQLGYFVPRGVTGFAMTVDVRWASDRIAYVFDVTNGTMDIVKYTGPLPRRGPVDTR
jgi:hypothetical protein